ncbi:MAG: cytochrome c oxidase subunit II [Hyphomonadaceae bacterium]|nr:cytochrome c oxidase subunit II [Hyphomonadaceae bacterium]
MKRGAMIAAAAAGAALAGASAWAAVGQPHDRGIDLQPPATQIMQDVHEFHTFILWIIVAISVLVLALLLWVIVRYNRRVNPTPRKFTHNIAVEVLWTVVPVLILVAIAWKSFPLLFQQERIPPAELTLKVTGNSWRWDFEYPDLGVQFTSNMLDEATARAEGRPYLLATDAPLYVPVDTTVRVLVTSNDVIHSFAVPAFGFKEDAIMGRVNEGWFNVDSNLAPPGTVVYGQCSELCGVNHAYMPVEIRIVSREEFDRWVEAQGGSLAAAGSPAQAPETAPTTPQPAPAGNPTR